MRELGRCGLFYHKSGTWEKVYPEREDVGAN